MLRASGGIWVTLSAVRDISCFVLIDTRKCALDMREGLRKPNGTTSPYAPEGDLYPMALHLR
jgi:hypothetical protein